MVIAPAQLADDVLPAAEPLPYRADSFLKRLLRHPLAISGLIIVVALIAIAVLMPFISPIDPAKPFPDGIDQLGRPHAPSRGYPLGADTLGRDVLTRTLYGTRISLTVAFCAMLTATLIGTAIGLFSGFFGGWTDAVLTRLTETVQSLPTILLAMALYKVLPSDSPEEKMRTLLLAIGIVTWTGIARAVRGQVLSLKEQEFIESARAIGCSWWRILYVHLLPNVFPTVIVLATLATANNILLEAGLSYLGLGIDPAQPSWGNMISEGQPYMLFAPWILLAPGCAIVIAVVGLNMLGQALQETLEPRQ